MSAYVPPNLRERRPIWVQAIELISLTVAIGTILAVSIYGAAVTSPLPGMIP